MNTDDFKNTITKKYGTSKTLSYTDIQDIIDLSIQNNIIDKEDISVEDVLNMDICTVQEIVEYIKKCRTAFLDKSICDDDCKYYTPVSYIKDGSGDVDMYRDRKNYGDVDMYRNDNVNDRKIYGNDRKIYDDENGEDVDIYGNMNDNNNYDNDNDNNNYNNINDNNINNNIDYYINKNHNNINTINLLDRNINSTLINNSKLNSPFKSPMVHKQTLENPFVSEKDSNNNRDIKYESPYNKNNPFKLQYTNINNIKSINSISNNNNNINKYNNNTNKYNNNININTNNANINNNNINNNSINSINNNTNNKYNNNINKTLFQSENDFESFCEDLRTKTASIKKSTPYKSTDIKKEILNEVIESFMKVKVGRDRRCKENRMWWGRISVILCLCIVCCIWSGYYKKPV